MADASPHFFVYCDASFDKRRGIGVISCLVFNAPKDHAAGDAALGTRETEILRETSNIRAELQGVLRALEIVQQTPWSNTSGDGAKVVHLYTDCRAVTELPRRRERLVGSGYVSKRTGTPLRNADLYRAFFSMQDQLVLVLNWVQGHRPATGKNLVEQNFAHVDRAARKVLRECLMKMNSAGKTADED
jgi:ribonuclease HI